MNIQEAMKQIQNYINSKSCSPFFVSADGREEYCSILQHLIGYSIIRTSSYCSENSYPDYDRLFDDLRHKRQTTVLLGLGTASMLSGNIRPLSRIKDQVLPYKLIVLCRQGSNILHEFHSQDVKFNRLRYCVVDSEYDCSIVRILPGIPFRNAYQSFRSFLSSMEDGVCGNLYVKTYLELLSHKTIEIAYQAVKEMKPYFPIPEGALTDQLWLEYLKDEELSGYPLDHWRTYIYYLLNPPENLYLQCVIRNSSGYEEYSENVFNYILEVDYKEKQFRQLYEHRKTLLHDVDPSGINKYVLESQQKGLDRIYYLTDSSSEERMEIVREITRIHRIPDELEWIYPELWDYLYEYDFSGDHAEVLTSYFQSYKLQKLFNQIDPDFLQQVQSLSSDGNRLYNALTSKTRIIESYDDGKTCLCWIDALGVEYLGFIQKKAAELGLSLQIKIGSASLPTLTCINKDFYDNWHGRKLVKIDDLDDIKHEGIQYEDANPLDAAIHLVKELEIIRKALETIKGKLLQNDYSVVVLASDHGASRLAVLYNSENKLEMSVKGKHSGRCCPISDVDKRPESASKDNGFWVLANYDRFKGGRKANVEVHGGASLEEVLVPVIRIELSKDANKPKIKLMNNNPQYSFDTDPVVVLFCPFDTSLLCIRIDGKRYIGTETTPHQYEIPLTNFKKAKQIVIAEVFDGDNKIAEFELTISSKAVKTDTAVDDFFS